LNQRENHMGIDLNRDYLNPATKEVIAHINYIEEQEPWDLSLIIHEDWESDGFYLYDKPTDLTDGWAKTIVERVRKVCPIDLSEAIDKMSSSEGIISPRFENIKEDPKLKGQWPEAIYLFMTEKVRGSFTFEAPSSYDMPTRIKALETAILTSVELLSTAE
ncbi:MAG: hypothetical protein O7F12_12260, partial [Nitrospirae bacterium]|nr:hypothetical protein [Nitrospirota bacterium]